MSSQKKIGNGFLRGLPLEKGFLKPISVQSESNQSLNPVMRQIDSSKQAQFSLEQSDTNSIPDEEKGKYRIVDRVGEIFGPRFELFDNEDDKFMLRGKEFQVDSDNDFIIHE